MSLNQSLIIHKFPILFKILNEIKSNLNFKIEYFDDDQFEKNLNNRNLVVISGDNKKKFKTSLKLKNTQ